MGRNTLSMLMYICTILRQNYDRHFSRVDLRLFVILHRGLQLREKLNLVW
jgi:hypothetical protein